MTTEIAIALGGFVGAISLMGLAAAVYGAKLGRRDMAAVARQEALAEAEYDRNKQGVIQEFSTLIADYHDVIDSHTGAERTAQKRRFMAMLKSSLPKDVVRLLVPYLEDGMSAEDFQHDMWNKPELFQIFLDASQGRA